MSAIFGAVHYFFKPMENWMDGLSVRLFGLFWCFTPRRTAILWFAIGFHAMSDYANMVLLAHPNTGNNGQSLTGHLLTSLTTASRGLRAARVERRRAHWSFLSSRFCLSPLRGSIQGSRPINGIRSGILSSKLMQKSARCAKVRNGPEGRATKHRAAETTG